MTTYRASTFKQEKSPAAWQQALGRLPNAHALQSWTWGAFKSRWGWQKIPLLLTVAESSWEPLAAAMILKRKIPRTPFSILYVPKGPILDYNDGPLRRQVLAQLEKVARQERAILIKIDPDVVKAWGEEQERPSPIGSQFTQELKARGWLFSNEQIQFRNTVELYLEPSEEELLMAMKQKTRYNIRYAGRKGITVREGGPVDFDTILQMYQETADRDDFTIRPPDYYRDAWGSLYEAGMAQPLLAEFEGEPVAAVILVRFGDKAIYMYGASTEKERRRMPNYLLQWEAIRWAKAQGYRTYDFWGAPDEFVEDDPLWGVWRFKSGFEGEVVHHIGAWDYPARPLFYKLYSQLLPRYLGWLRNRTT
jgi:peptidoglycan pentaglycine glycine transferase (the first glycine)